MKKSNLISPLFLLVYGKFSASKNLIKVLVLVNLLPIKSLKANDTGDIWPFTFEIISFGRGNLPSAFNSNPSALIGMYWYSCPWNIKLFSNPFSRVKFSLFRLDLILIFDKILRVDLLLVRKGQI